GGVAAAGLAGAVDVADEAGSAADRRHLHGAIKPAGLGRVDRHDLRRALLDDLDDVVRVPGSFVRHHRRVDGAGDLGHALEPVDRRLIILVAAAFHPPVGLDRHARGGIALVGIDADLDRGPDRIADALDDGDVAIAVDADLHLDGADAFLGGLHYLALGVFDRN